MGEEIILGSKSREEGEIGSENREKGDLLPCSSPLYIRDPKFNETNSQRKDCKTRLLHLSNVVLSSVFLFD